MKHLQNKSSEHGLIGGLRTGPVNRGQIVEQRLISADRSSKATLLLTVPRSSQVVCKGSTPTSGLELRLLDMFLSPDEPSLSLIG